MTVYTAIVPSGERAASPRRPIFHITSGVKRAALISSAVSRPFGLLDSGTVCVEHEAAAKDDAIITIDIAFFMV